ncbi:MAG TPA: YtxH domain-containing protein [Candidatus Limnocylindrales bacterium]|nr:YtxH domain-containing protein [Candidatus Limnocylindrales bacterium]
MSNKRNIAVGTVLVAAAGYVAGLLTAPKSGRETRKDIRTAAQKAKGEAERKLKNAHGELTKLVNDASEMAKSSKHKANDELKKALEKANNVRLKTRVVLSAIHEGEAEDRDLQKALDDVKAAIKHLKQYATKPQAKKAE